MDKAEPCLIPSMPRVSPSRECCFKGCRECLNTKFDMGSYFCQPHRAHMSAIRKQIYAAKNANLRAKELRLRKIELCFRKWSDLGHLAVIDCMECELLMQ